MSGDFVQDNLVLSIIVAAVIITLVIYMFIMAKPTLENKKEKLRSDATVTFNLRDRGGAPNLGQASGGATSAAPISESKDPRFNLRRREAFKGGYDGCGAYCGMTKSEIYALGLQDHDWQTWRDEEEASLEQLSSDRDCKPCGITSNIHALGLRDEDWGPWHKPTEDTMYEGFASRQGGVQISPSGAITGSVLGSPRTFAGPSGVMISTGQTVYGQDRSWKSQNPANFSFRKEFMGNSANSHVFTGPPGYDVTVAVPMAKGVENLSNRTGWQSRMERMDEPSSISVSNREQKLNEALLGLSGH